MYTDRMVRRRLLAVIGIALFAAGEACVGDVPFAEPADGGSLDTGTPVVDAATDSTADTGPGADAAGSDTGTDTGNDADGAVGMVPCNGSLNCARYVFVTSTLYSPSALGAGGGISGANLACATRANTNALLGGRAWQAWLSIGGSPAAGMVHGTRPYRRVDGTAIANDWNDLVNGTIAASLSIDETGTALSAGFKAWTGTNPDGTVLASACADWTNNIEGFGTQGSTVALDANWTNSSAGPCTDTARIYCFEQ